MTICVNFEISYDDRYQVLSVVNPRIEEQHFYDAESLVQEDYNTTIPLPDLTYIYTTNSTNPGDIEKRIQRILEKSLKVVKGKILELDEEVHDVDSVIADQTRNEYCVVFDGYNRFAVFDEYGTELWDISESLLYFPDQITLDCSELQNLEMSSKDKIKVEISKETYEELKRLKKI